MLKRGLVRSNSTALAWPRLSLWSHESDRLLRSDLARQGEPHAGSGFSLSHVFFPPLSDEYFVKICWWKSGGKKESFLLWLFYLRAITDHGSGNRLQPFLLSSGNTAVFFAVWSPLSQSDQLPLWSRTTLRDQKMRCWSRDLQKSLSAQKSSTTSPNVSYRWKRRALGTGF